LSLERLLPWRPRRCEPPQATCAGPSCEGPSLHRGPVRAVKDRVGTWETSGRPQPPRRSRVGSGRRGAEAGSEGRRRLHSTDEASNNVGRRADGGDGGGKGRRKGKGQRMPRTQRRNRHVPDGLSPRTGTGAQAPNASDLRQEPGAGKPHAGICAGGRRQLLSLPRRSLPLLRPSRDMSSAKRASPWSA
jgi:hypothetical protein